MYSRDQTAVVAGLNPQRAARVAAEGVTLVLELQSHNTVASAALQ